MKPQFRFYTLAAVLLVFILSACKKETAESKEAAFDLQLLNGGTWSNSQNSASVATMKFRFYGNSNVTYSFRTAVYPSLKYDSFPQGRYEFIQPDTLRLYDRSWNCYGYLQVLSLTNTALQSRMPGYSDIIVFKKEK